MVRKEVEDARAKAEQAAKKDVEDARAKAEQAAKKEEMRKEFTIKMANVHKFVEEKVAKLLKTQGLGSSSNKG